MFDLRESAIAYAKCAERILGTDTEFLNSNQEVIPIFVAQLFQSLEISLKHLGIESQLFSKEEARSRKLANNGHGIEELAKLVNSRLGANRDHPVTMAMTAGIKNSQTNQIIHQMIFSKEFEQTRLAYQSRRLGYAEIVTGELQLFDGIRPWVHAVRDVAENLPTAINVVSEWKNSHSASKSFAIWYK